MEERHAELDAELAELQGRRESLLASGPLLTRGLVPPAGTRSATGKALRLRQVNASLALKASLVLHYRGSGVSRSVSASSGTAGSPQKPGQAIFFSGKGRCLFLKTSYKACSTPEPSKKPLIMQRRLEGAWAGLLAQLQPAPLEAQPQWIEPELPPDCEDAEAQTDPVEPPPPEPIPDPILLTLAVQVCSSLAFHRGNLAPLKSSVDRCPCNLQEPSLSEGSESTLYILGYKAIAQKDVVVQGEDLDAAARAASERERLERQLADAQVQWPVMAAEFGSLLET